LESKGYIVPVQQIQVSPKISGEITGLHFREGDFVKAGTLLAEIEDVNYRADRDHAQAVLEEAQENLLVLTRYRPQEIEQAKARWEEADAQRVQLNMDRKRSLLLRSGSAMAARDYEQADSQFMAMDRRARALRLDYELLMHGPRDLNIKASEARVQEARADLAKYQWQLDNCRIVAPVTGIILTKKAEVHNIVNPTAFNISASLCDMADLSKLEVDLSIQERDVARLAVGQHCIVRPEAFAHVEYQGTVSRLMPVADRAKGAVSVRVQVHIPQDLVGKHLLPERSALVTFLNHK
jgi:multidrug resistance efflux pump